MNHPSREDWMSYLYDELPPTRRTDLQAHLGVCPDCKKAVESWRATMGRLDTWAMPSVAPKRPWHPTVVRWAAAAVVVLGAGFLFGRLSAPAGVDANQLRTELRNEFSDQVQKSLDASRTETQQALETLATAWARARQEDQQNTLALLQRAEISRQTDFASLRRDLETVAFIGEQGLRSTRNQLARLSSYGAESEPAYDLIPANLNNERKSP